MDLSITKEKVRIDVKYQIKMGPGTYRIKRSTYHKLTYI